MHLLLPIAMVAVLAGPVPADKAATAEWTGYVTDTHCGEGGAGKDHTAKCVEKCMKTGSKAQLWSETDKKAFDLDGYDKVKSLVGKKVVVRGTLDAQTNTIKVESAAKAEGK